MKIKIKNRSIETVVADSFWKRFVGLSFSKKKNMFFVFPSEETWSLWMFAVSYPIKMIFIDKNKKVVDIKRGEPLSFDKETWKTYRSKKPCKYILETQYDLKIKINDKLRW